MKCLSGKEGLLCAHLCIPSVAKGIWLSCSVVLRGWRKDEMFAHHQARPTFLHWERSITAALKQVNL